MPFGTGAFPKKRRRKPEGAIRRRVCFFVILSFYASSWYKGEIECGEAHAIAGHEGRRNRLKGARDAEPLPRKQTILGMIKRSGEVIIEMLENVQTATIAPLIQLWNAKGRRYLSISVDLALAMACSWAFNLSICRKQYSKKF